MTDLDINETRKLADAAEDGPWRAVEHPMEGDHPDGWPLIVVTAENGRDVVSVVEDDVASASETPRENAEFIAHARTALPKALDEIERLRGLVRSVIALTKTTDGDELRPDAEIPVGELYRVLYVEPGRNAGQVNRYAEAVSRG